MSEEKPKRMSIRNAAKEIGRSREYVRRLIDACKLTAYRVGGTDAAPWLEVDMGELRKVVDADSIYIPPHAIAKKPRFRASTRIDPLVSRW